jgi:hypothetical protein
MKRLLRDKFVSKTDLKRGERERTNIKRLAAFAYDAFQTRHKSAGCAGLLLNVAVPVGFARAEDDLFGVCGHGV